MAPKPRKSTVTTRKRTQGNFNLGGEIAEADALLDQAFFDSVVYRAMISKSGDRRCFIIGRTGSGKSATLRRIKSEAPDHVIEINPTDLSLPYITDLGVVRYLTSLDVHLDSLYNALWKHVLLIEIIKHRYKIDSPDAKQRFLSSIMDRIKRDNKKKLALEYLEEFEGKFWCETDERVRDITNKFESQFKAAAGGRLTAGPATFELSSSDQSNLAGEERVELIRRFQRVVNETQLPRLNTMMSVLNDDILNSPQNFTYVIIDDLDKDWADDRVKNDLIRNLFQVVLDLTRVINLKVVVALRTNIFESIDFGRSGGQGEKFRSLTMPLWWTSHELEGLLSERARIQAAKLGIGPVVDVAQLLPNANATRGNALDYILDRTLMRPRDAIAYLNACFGSAGGAERLTWEDMKAAETAYSRNRLLALRDEWEPTFPGIDSVLQKFRHCQGSMTRAAVTKYLDDVLELMPDYQFEGVQWLTQVCAPFWNGSPDDDWADTYHKLVKLLYDIGFLGIQGPRDNAPIFSQDEPELAESVLVVRNAARFAIHPAFRAALEVTDARPGDRRSRDRAPVGS